MKIRYEIEMTPEELRRAFGLPDVAKMMADSGADQRMTDFAGSAQRAAEAYNAWLMSMMSGGVFNMSGGDDAAGDKSKK